jgi:hypothetical protein
MNQHHRLLRKFQGRYFVKSLLFCFVACGITAALFSPPGLINHYSGIDLSFILLPVLGYFIIRLVSKQIGVLVFPAEGALAAYLLDGAALSFGAYFFFSQAHLLARVPFLSSSEAFLENLSHIAGYLIIVIAGYTLLKVSGFIHLILRRNVSPLFSAAGWGLIGLGLWLSLNEMAGSWSPLSGVGLILLVSSLVLAVTKISLYTANTSIPLLSNTAQWLAARPAEKFLGAAVITVYFVFLREYIFRHFATAYLIEWLLFCLLSWRIFTVIKNNLEKSYVVPLSDSGWQKHEQIVDDRIDENFNKLVLMQEDFIIGGSRRELMLYFRQVLIRNGRTEEEIAGLLQPVIEHSDRKMPWYAWGFIRRRILNQNRVKRQKSLEDAMQNLTGSFTT